MQLGNALAREFCGAGEGGPALRGTQKRGGGLRLIIAIHGVAVVLEGRKMQGYCENTGRRRSV